MTLPEPSYDPGSPTDDFKLEVWPGQHDGGFWPPDGTPLGNGRLYRQPKAESPHSCRLPGWFQRKLAGVNLGDIWECSCGSRWCWKTWNSYGESFSDWTPAKE